MPTKTKLSTLLRNTGISGRNATNSGSRGAFSLHHDLERSILTTAKQSDANTRYRRRMVPGSSELLRLGLRDDIQDIPRFPRGQAFVSHCRLVTCARASAGKRDGPAGTKMGTAALTWACSDAAGLFWRAHLAGQH
jgi:hypothetical protein